MLEGVGKFSEQPYKVRGKQYTRYVIFVPKLVALDSAFPLKPGDKVLIKVEGNKVIIEPLKEKS